MVGTSIFIAENSEIPLDYKTQQQNFKDLPSLPMPKDPELVFCYQPNYTKCTYQKTQNLILDSIANEPTPKTLLSATSDNQPQN